MDQKYADVVPMAEAFEYLGAVEAGQRVSAR